MLEKPNRLQARLVTLPRNGMAKEEGKFSGEILQNFVQFLSKSSPAHTRAIAVQYLLGCTGTEEGRRFVDGNPAVLTSVVDLMNDEQPAIAKDAYLSLVNLTTDHDLSSKLIVGRPDFVPFLLRLCLSDANVHADIACMSASNLSRWERCVPVVAKCIVGGADDDDLSVRRVVETFAGKPDRLNYLATFLSNMTQLQEVRRSILNKERCVLQRLLPLISVRSLVVRGGVVGTLRNCCFETEFHEWLLSESVDILPRLLLPLAGPEQFDEDDTEKLPEDLQYLDDTKEREPDPDIRQMLVESINRLCATKPCRQFIKDKNAYVILRELHKWEKEESVVTAIENLVCVLISDEPEAGMENLDAVEIPRRNENLKLTKTESAEREHVDAKKIVS